MIYLLLITAAIALALLYKFSPTPKIFIIICTLLIFVFGASAFIRLQQDQQEQITRAQLEELLKQQKNFRRMVRGVSKGHRPTRPKLAVVSQHH